MKLIFVNRYFFPDHSATSQLLTDLALDQASRGREVHVVTSRQRYMDPDAALAPFEEIGGVRVHRVWTSSLGRHTLAGRSVDYSTFYMSAAVRLLLLTRRGDVIVAETDPPLISVVAAGIAALRGAILVNWLQDLFPEIAIRLGMKWLDGPIGKLAAVLRDRSLKSARWNIALGSRMAGEITRIVADGASVRVIHNWADGGKVAPIPREDNPLRSAWGLRDRFVVGYSGNMGRAHDFEGILAACETLRARPDIVFLFIGDGPQRKRIADETARRSLSNVRFQPYQPRELLAQSLCTADVHLVTLKPNLEGLALPSKFYGIAAAGRPAIAIGDPDGEIARIVKSENCGIVVKAGDVEALVAAIERLSGDAESVRLMGSRARRAFERRFDLPLALGHWDAVLEELLPERRD